MGSRFLLLLACLLVSSRAFAQTAGDTLVMESSGGYSEFKHQKATITVTAGGGTLLVERQPYDGPAPKPVTVKLSQQQVRDLWARVGTQAKSLADGPAAPAGTTDLADYRVSIKSGTDSHEFKVQWPQPELMDSGYGKVIGGITSFVDKLAPYSGGQVLGVSFTPSGAPSPQTSPTATAPAAPQLGAN